MKEYKRICPQCKKELSYSYPQSFYLAKRKNSICKVCRSTERASRPECRKMLIQNGKRFVGENNPFYGKKHSDETKDKIRNILLDKKYWETAENKGGDFYKCWVDKYGKDIADVKLSIFKQHQSNVHMGNKNSMFGKPSPQGSGNGWSGWYKGWYFRSLLELSYMVKVIERFGLKWESAEKKELKIPYQDWSGANKNYFADFLIEDKYLVECKPKKLHNSVLVQSKANGAKQFCGENGLTYKLRYVNILSRPVIKELVESGVVKFLPRYQGKFELEYKNI